MSDYKYKTPEGKLYKVSVRKWNKHFGNRGRLLTAECYIDEATGVATIQFIPTIGAKVLVTLLLPVSVLFAGLSNVKELWEDYVRGMSSKKYGAFSSDVIYKGKINGTGWKKLCGMLGIEETDND